MSLFKPFNRSSAEVIEIIEQVSSGTMDCRDWDNFISIPIKGNPEMEAVRAQCEALSGDENIEPSGIIRHSEKARQELLQILLKLQSLS